MAGRRCNNCPTILTNGQTTCTTCQRTLDKQRGTREQRGYGKTFQAERRKWQQLMKTKTINCWRCKQPINPNTTWHLGHDDNNRNTIRGPEHAHCNLTAAGKASHAHT